MARLLLVLVLALVGDSLQQDQCDAQTSKILELLQSNPSCNDLTDKITSIKTQLTQQMKTAVDQADIASQKAKEDSDKYESSIFLLRNSLVSEFSGVHSGLSTEIKNSVEKAEADAKKAKEERQNLEVSIANVKSNMESALSSLTSRMGQEHASLRSQLSQQVNDAVSSAVQKILCDSYKAKLSGKTMRKLETGVYHYSPQTFRYENALQHCLNYGMHLAQFDSSYEMSTVVSSAPEYDENYWVAASDIGTNAGNFRWTDGGSVSSSFWKRNNPNEYGRGKDTCVDFKRSVEGLMDHSCGDRSQAVCEVPAQYRQCF